MPVRTLPRLLAAFTVALALAPTRAISGQGASGPQDAARSESLRDRLGRMNVYSLDVEVFAYLRARDWNHFLEVQEQLLFAVMEIMRNAGTDIAFPSQTLYATPPQPAALPPSRSST